MAVLTPIIIGAIGTAIASYFQEKNWRHQNEVQSRESEREKATQLFDTLSSAMDTRLFSMRQVFWGIDSPNITEQEVKERWAAYRSTLVTWNNSLNRNLSMVERYFGDKARVVFEEQIQPGFRRLGLLLADYYYNVDKRKDFDKGEFSKTADALNELMREANIAMIKSIQDGRVGIFNPAVE